MPKKNSNNTRNESFELEPETDPNDKIDIYGKIDAIAKKRKGSIETEFIAEISGMNIDYSVVNAIRRTILMSIPIYGFHRSNIYIDADKSYNMYNNDMIYNLIETLPIYDIPNNFDLENPEFFLSNEVLKSLFGNFVQEQRVGTDTEKKVADKNKRLFKIDFVLDVKNTTGSDMFVSTHNAIIKVDGKTSDGYTRRRPISIMVLKPGEEISLRVEANLGIAQMNAIYEATTNAVHKEISPMKYELVYETLEQLDKNIIFVKACIILIKKLENLKDYIHKRFPDEPEAREFMELELFGENHTMGNLIATALQKCKFVSKAGYSMPHPFNELIVIRYQLEKNAKIGQVKLFMDVLDYLIKVFETISSTAFKKKE